MYIFSIPLLWTFAGDNFTAVYLEDVPIGSIPLGKGLPDVLWFLLTQLRVCCTAYTISLPSCCLADLTGHAMSPFLLINFEYGPNYSGPGWAQHCTACTVCTNVLICMYISGRYHYCISPLAFLSEKTPFLRPVLLARLKTQMKAISFILLFTITKTFIIWVSQCGRQVK